MLTLQRALLPLFLWMGLLPAVVSAQTVPKDLALEVSASSHSAGITLTWPSKSGARSYSISRKQPTAQNWNSLVTLPSNSTSFTDPISQGQAFEYKLVSDGDIPAYGYLLGGNELPPIEYRGRILLVVANRYAATLSSELGQLQMDLIGDGWLPTRIDVDERDTPSSVRARIVQEYRKFPESTRSVILFGHVPVPRSGNFAPDSHDNHVGAWAADTYYADVDGVWTDYSVNNTSAERDDNYNRPGDLKFDQSRIPTSLELQVGRIDFNELTNFSNKSYARGELDLLRQYLKKDHLFRQGGIKIQERLALDDNFGYRDGEAYTDFAYRNAAALFGLNHIQTLSPNEYFPTLRTQEFLWSVGDGGGQYTSCAGVGGSDDVALTDVHSVFTSFFGSYFGDWDNESNFLRSSLGSTSFTLTAVWSGRPNWFFHRMGLGFPIGDSAVVSQNNEGLYQPTGLFARGVHTALLGDPTLRARYLTPPSSVGLSEGRLTWSASADSGIEKYYIYWAPNFSSVFVRLGDAAASTTSFPIDNPNGVYMVRSLRLEHTGSGSYYNLSQGAFSENFGEGSGTVSTSTTEPHIVSLTKPYNLKTRKDRRGVYLSWNDTSIGASGDEIQRRINRGKWKRLKIVRVGVHWYLDRVARIALRFGRYEYRVRPVSQNAKGAFSSVIRYSGKK